MSLRAVFSSMTLADLDHIDRDLFFEKSKTLLQDSFVKKLQKRRGAGRNDYPIEELLGYIFYAISHKLPSLAALEKRFSKLPPSSAFSRFITALAEAETLLDETLLKKVDVGSFLALGTYDDGPERHYFLTDISSGIPFLWHKAPRNNDCCEEALILCEKNPHRVDRYLIAGKEFYPLSEMLWQRFRIKPIIDKQPSSNPPKNYKNVRYLDNAEVLCEGASMVYAGFEESRESLKFRCAAKHYGYLCQSYDHCSLKSGIRIPLKVDPSVFTPLPRFSYRFERLLALSSRLKEIGEILFSSIPYTGKKTVFLRIASLLFAVNARGNE